ncbi:hypothetical protein PAMA_019845 [Pampus argenteus]
MASGSSADGVEESEVLLLLREYCGRRSRRRSKRMVFPHKIQLQGVTDHESAEVQFRSGWGAPTFHAVKDESGGSPASTRTAVAVRLEQIAESAPILEANVGDQDEIIQKLVDLVKTAGDDINKKIQQNVLLQQQLSALTYDMFERVTSKVQRMVGPEASDRRTQKQRIAWAFEVTSRLSAMDFVPRRRVLSFGDRYIQQHHDAWLQQHGGWEEVFDDDNVD